MKLTNENFQDLITLTDEQNMEFQFKFNETIRDELLKPENQEYLKKIIDIYNNFDNEK